MAKDLTSVQELQRSQLEGEAPWIWLFDMEVPTDPPTRFRITNYTRQVQFGTNTLGAPLVYYPFPVAHGGIEQTSDGSLPAMDVSVANVSREISSQLALYGGFIGRPVVVRLVNVSELTNAQAQIREDSIVRGVRVTNGVVTFTLSPYNLLERRFPPFRVTPTHCRFLFGGSECGYDLTTGGFTTCAKTIDACRERGADELSNSLPVLHPERFGGFPGVPQ